MPRAQVSNRKDVSNLLWVFWSGLAAAAAIAVILAFTSYSTLPYSPYSAAAHQRDQAQRTMTIHGYHAITGLEIKADGSWHANAEKDGARWRLEISPYGVVRTEMEARAEDTVTRSKSP
jgi:hypothetical protein